MLLSLAGGGSDHSCWGATPGRANQQPWSDLLHEPFQRRKFFFGRAAGADGRKRICLADVRSEGSTAIVARSGPRGDRSISHPSHTWPVSFLFLCISFPGRCPSLLLVHLCSLGPDLSPRLFSNCPFLYGAMIPVNPPTSASGTRIPTR